MNKIYNKLERKLGRYAIPNLTFILIGCYVIGYLLTLFNSGVEAYMTLEPALILKGQVWRLITWLVIPPSSLNLFTIIMLMFYLSIGRSLENTWGAFRYNFYIIGGIVLTIIAAFVSYAVFSLIYGMPVMFGSGSSSPFSTYYICMSIFLGFAATFPDVQVLLYFVIPIKVKWLGYLYAAFLLYDGIGYVRSIMNGYTGAVVYLVAMVASLLNFVIFFFSTRDFRRFSAGEIRRRRAFSRGVREGERVRYERVNKPGSTQSQNRTENMAGEGSAAPSAAGRPARHRCEICGRTDVTDPDMDFRFCSKCRGSHEYCSDHLFTHTHQQ